MKRAEFIDALNARRGEADVWLVYQADAYSLLLGDDTTLTLHRAFWTRGEAYSCAHTAHRDRQWQHYSVFRVLADHAWAATEEPRLAEFEAAFERIRILPVVEIVAAALAEALS